MGARTVDPSRITCYAANRLGPDVMWWQALLIEFIMTFHLLTVVNAASDASKFNQARRPRARPDRSALT